MTNFFRASGFLLTFAAFLCLFLSTFSTPYLKGLYFVRIEPTTANSGVYGSLSLGTLGYCASGNSSTTLNNTNLLFNMTSGCVRQRGYSLPPELFMGDQSVDALGQEVDLTKMQNVLMKGLTNALVLVPVAAAAAASSCILALLGWKLPLGSRLFEIFAFFFTILSTIAAIIVAGIMTQLFQTARSRVFEASGGQLSGSLGHGIGLVWAGAVSCATDVEKLMSTDEEEWVGIGMKVALMVSLVSLLLGMCTGGKSSKK